MYFLAALVLVCVDVIVMSAGLEGWVGFRVLCLCGL